MNLASFRGSVFVQTRFCRTHLQCRRVAKRLSGLPFSVNTRRMNSTTTDVEDLHKLACRQGSKTYIDPPTGFQVFTEVYHLSRTKCCGNQCRHCPYGWENVSSASRPAKLKSGDVAAAERLLQEYGVDLPPVNTFVKSPSTTTSTATDSLQASRTETTQQGKGGRKGGRLTSKNVPYTRGGDKGTSQLLTGERRSKADDAFEAMGTVDELCSVIGVAHSLLGDTEAGELDQWLLEIMSRLFDIGSHVASPRKIDDTGVATNFKEDGVGGGLKADHIDVLEDWVDLLTEKLPELTSFILPTGTTASAQLQVARCVCRRAERRMVPLVQAGACDPNALKYVNRLSDFLFSAARYVNYVQGTEEILYRREFRGAKQRTRTTLPPNK